MATKVRDAMTPAVRATAPGASLVDAAQAMKQEDVGSLPVVEDGRLVGVLTDRDVVLRAVAEKIDPQSVRVGDVASRDLITARPEQDLDDALSLMARHQVRRPPVVDGNELVGILAQADIAAGAGDRKAGEVVGKVSRPTSIPHE